MTCIYHQTSLSSTSRGPISEGPTDSTPVTPRTAPRDGHKRHGTHPSTGRAGYVVGKPARDRRVEPYATPERAPEAPKSAARSSAGEIARERPASPPPTASGASEVAGALLQPPRSPPGPSEPSCEARGTRRLERRQQLGATEGTYTRGSHEAGRGVQEARLPLPAH